MAEKRRLWHSAPLRQALLLVIVVAVVNLATLGGAWLKMRADLSAELAQQLAQEMAGMDISATAPAMATLVEARARASDPRETVFAFLGTDGRQAGNARADVSGSNVVLSARDPARPLGEAGYIHEIRRLSGGVLIVAKSLSPVQRLRDTFLSLLVFSLVPTVLISLGIGTLIARREARRVKRIEAALAAMAAGDLSARVRAEGDDDLSRVGRGVDRMAKKQEAATEALRQVSSDIAHDLRTPLQRIAVTLDELRMRLPETGETADLAARASEEAERAVAVFRALLQIAQIEGGSPAARFAPVDLGEVARRVADLYEPAAEDRGDDLRLILPELPTMVRGDADLLGQALANLIENALRHTDPGARIAITVAPGLLRVADNGPGIPEPEREKVRRRLYRLEHSRTTPGNGLGLALVDAIAALHGAELKLGDNAPGLVVELRFGEGAAVSR